MSDEEQLLLRLYVSGSSPRSQAALRNLRELCEREVSGRYELEVIDLSVEPSRARTDQIVAVPTLVRRLPLPFKRIIGDLSDVEQVLIGLALESRP